MKKIKQKIKHYKYILVYANKKRVDIITSEK